MSKPDTYAKCACQHCGGHIAYPLQAAGQTIACPHCGQPTALPPVPSGPKLALLVFGIAAILILATGGVILYTISHHPAPPVAKQLPPPPAPKPKPEPPPDPWHGLKAGKVTLEKSGDGNLIYAIGTLHNSTTRQRFGVKVVLDVLNDTHKKIGAATDYTDVIEPGKDWKFKALITDRAASGASLVSVTEQ